jgi:hypothetical protein
MSQTWRVVAEAESSKAAELVSAAAQDAVEGVDCHHVKDTIYGYTEDEETARDLASALEQSGRDVLESSPRVERWSHARGEWVPPSIFDAIGEDDGPDPPPFDPAEIDYARLHIEVRASTSQANADALGEKLNAHRFPVLVVHNGVRVGATDERQAAEIANLIRLELGATIIESRPFTRLGRWSFHHQVVGGYAKE